MSILKEITRPVWIARYAVASMAGFLVGMAYRNIWNASLTFTCIAGIIFALSTGMLRERFYR